MKVLFRPDWRGGNPYQQLLADAVAAQGQNVMFRDGRSRFARLWGALARRTVPQVIHLHWTHRFVVASGRLASVRRSCKFMADLVLARLSGTKIVWTVHNLVNHEGRHASLELFFNRLIARLCDCLIVHYPEAVEIVRREYSLPASARIEVVPHGHFIGSYPNFVDRREARQRLGVGCEDTVLLFFGAVRSYKEVPELIDAFRSLSHAGLRLIIAGRPFSEEIRKDIQALCTGDARIQTRLEFIPDDEVQDLMNAADAVILPTRDMLTSGSALLAMSFGKAIIAPNTPHLSYLLDGSGGILYEDHLGKGLRKALAEAHTDDLRRMGKRNLEQVLNFSWDEVGKKTSAIYGSLIRDRDVSIPRKHNLETGEVHGSRSSEGGT